MDDSVTATRHSEPGPDGPGGNARWAAYLDWARSDVADSVQRLPAAEQRTSHVPTGWTPLEMLSHVLHMERRWLVWGFLGEQVTQPWGDWNVDEPWTSDDSGETHPGARWKVPERVTVELLVSQLDEQGARTRDILRNHPLDAAASTGGQFQSDPPTLEWICFHVFKEYGRHAGQLDVALELVP